MKLVKALNGDWVNVAHASSFNVADFGNRAVVYARVGNVSYEIFSAGWQEGLDAKAGFKAAESFLDDLFKRLGEVLNVPDNELKSIFLEPQYTWTIEMELPDSLKAAMKEGMENPGKVINPKKRTPRKKADPDA
jgi:hypothetical protein